jgi:hypothetical protein
MIIYSHWIHGRWSVARLPCPRMKSAPAIPIGATARAAAKNALP